MYSYTTLSPIPAHPELQQLRLALHFRGPIKWSAPLFPFFFFPFDITVFADLSVARQLKALCAANNPNMGASAHHNAPDLGWIIQKFGGTSVGKFPDKVSLARTAFWKWRRVYSGMRSRFC